MFFNSEIEKKKKEFQLWTNLKTKEEGKNATGSFELDIGIFQ